VCWPEDYLDAHDRHWEDAELLFQEGRLANADHLYGLSAECGLKALWLRITRLTSLPRRQRVHINHFWDDFVRLSRNQRSSQMLGGRLPPQNPFSNWSVNQRYASRQHFDQRLMEAHRRGAERVRNLVQNARQGGWI